MHYCVAACIIIWDEETRSIYLLGSGPPGRDTDNLQLHLLLELDVHQMRLHTVRPTTVLALKRRPRIEAGVSPSRRCAGVAWCSRREWRVLWW